MGGDDRGPSRAMYQLGKLGPDDEVVGQDGSSVKLAVGLHPDARRVVVSFGEEDDSMWCGLTPEAAIEFAETIKEQAQRLFGPI